MAARRPTIAWLPWSAAAFARARAERKPVLLSIAPSWCRNVPRDGSHELRRSGVAALVDAALRADPGRRGSPARHQRALQPRRLADDGVPDARRRDPRRRHLRDRRPAGRRAAARRRRVRGRAACTAAARSASAVPPSPRAGDAPPSDCRRADRQVDVDVSIDEHGGFGDRTEVSARRAGPPGPRAVLETQGSERRSATSRSATLDAMGWGPLYDERDGGFFRYSGDARLGAAARGEAARRQRRAARLYVDAARRCS